MAHLLNSHSNGSTAEPGSGLQAELAASGYPAMKTNIFQGLGEGDGPTMYMAGFGGGEGGPELNVPKPEAIAELVAQMRAFREGAGAFDPATGPKPSLDTEQLFESAHR